MLCCASPVTLKVSGDVPCAPRSQFRKRGTAKRPPPPGRGGRLLERVQFHSPLSSGCLFRLRPIYGLFCRCRRFDERALRSRLHEVLLTQHLDKRIYVYVCGEPKQAWLASSPWPAWRHFRSPPPPVACLRSATETSGPG